MTKTQPGILIVDADILVRHPLGAYLRECGYRVIETANADEATAILNETTVSVQVALVDVGDSEAFNGFALAQWIRAERKAVEVILVGSIKKAAEEAAQLCEEGPELSKPYQPEVVVSRIKRLLDQASTSQRTDP